MWNRWGNRRSNYTIDKTQQEAHKIERVVRHGIVVLVLMLLWGGLFYYIKKTKTKLQTIT